MNAFLLRFNTVLAVLAWPSFLWAAITRDWTVIFVPLVITAGAAVQRGALRKLGAVPRRRYDVAILGRTRAGAPSPRKRKRFDISEDRAAMRALADRHRALRRPYLPAPEYCHGCHESHLEPGRPA